MRVVCDTNIFISAFVIPGNLGERALLFARRKRFDLYPLVAILMEVAQKLREKFDQEEEDIKRALQIVSRAVVVLKPPITLNVLKDIPDNRIFECALAARTDLVVTGDRHLLDLKQFQGIPIVRLVDFVRMFPNE